MNQFFKIKKYSAIKNIILSACAGIKYLDKTHLKNII